MKKTLLTLSAIVIAGAIAVPSFADDKTDSDKIFTEGIAAYEKKDYEGARKKFADSYAKYPSPNALFNLARVEQVLGKNLDAYRHYRAYSELPDNPKITPAERAEAKQRIQEILTKIGRIVIVAPQGAKVVIDGVALENQTESVPVEPGSHQIDLIVMSETRKKSVTCGPGEIHQVKWDEGAAPAPEGDAGAGTASEDAGAPTTDDAGVQPGGETPHGMPPLLLGGLVVAGIGVLGLVGGGAFGLVSNSDANTVLNTTQPGDCFPQSSPRCVSLQSKVDEANTFNTVSIASWITGGVLLAGGITMVVLGVMHSKHAAEKTTLFVPVLLPGGGAAGLRGQF